VPEIQRHFEGMKEQWSRDWGCGPGASRSGRWNSRGFTRSGNAAFDDYRDRELKRLEEERRRLDEDLRDFEGYMNDLRRARDQEEFDRYMRERSSRRARNEASGGSGTGNSEGDNRPRVDL